MLAGDMMNSRFKSEAALRFAERRQREEEAPRLRERFPALATLRLEIEETLGSTNAFPKHTRIVMVDTAPALFTTTCADRACKEGGHDITNDMMRGLQSGSTRFDVEDSCHGSVGVAGCGRTMHVQVTATYR